MHVKTISDEVLLKVAEDLDMVPELCHFNDIEGKQWWEPWRLRHIVSKLDDLGLIKRPAANVYFSRTYGWGVEAGIHSRADFNTKKEAFEYAIICGYEPVEEDDD